MKTKIIILGEYNSDRKARAMIEPALDHSAKKIGVEIEYAWISEENIENDLVKNCQGVFVAPGSPTEESQKILQSIKTARVGNIPCLGTCGGFQRIVSEYAINVLEIKNIEHQEVTPDAMDPFFFQLQCSLVGQKVDVELVPNSLISKIYGEIKIKETFFCSYGVNPIYADILDKGGLMISGIDAQGIARVVELPIHPFFLGTLFVPQVRSTEDCPHPVITAFLKAAMNRAEQVNNPFQGLTLEMILKYLVAHYDWEGLGARINVLCFNNDPSIKSSLKFLRKTPWAREKVENLYLWHKRMADK
jgi:CTP synthase (UTP-ammonia lyase)